MLLDRHLQRKTTKLCIRNHIVYVTERRYKIKGTKLVSNREILNCKKINKERKLLLYNTL